MEGESWGLKGLKGLKSLKVVLRAFLPKHIV